MAADVTIKDKGVASDALVKARVYYDLNIQKTIYDVSFPSSETWAFFDTLMYRFSPEEEVQTIKTAPIAEFSLFHLCLTGKLENFGLNGDLMTEDGTELMDDQVITTYIPHKRIEKYVGKVLLSRKEGNLFVLIIYNSEGELAGQQFFMDYVNEGGLSVPSRIVQVTHSKGEKFYREIRLENIKVNDLEQEAVYDMDLPE